MDLDRRARRRAAIRDEALQWTKTAVVIAALATIFALLGAGSLFLIFGFTMAVAVLVYLAMRGFTWAAKRRRRRMSDRDGRTGT